MQQVDPPAAGIPVFTEYPEEAGIIITSSLTNLDFESNMGGIVANQSQPNSGRYVLIIKPYTQIFVVNAPGFIQARFRVSNPEPRSVAYFTIEAKEQAGGEIPVNFLVDPLPATLYVDNNQVDFSRPVPLSPGEHEIRIEKEGYRSVTQEIAVSLQQTLFRYSLQQIRQVPVTISSVPDQAVLFIDNQNVGFTNYSEFVYPGEYVIRMSRSGYKDLETQITVQELTGGDASTLNRFNFELQRFIGTLSIAVDPLQAQISVNGRPIGQQRLIEVRPGQHLIEVSMEGYEPFSQTVTVTENQTTPVTVNLRQYLGSLQFRVEPTSSRVQLVNAKGDTVRQWSGLNIIDDLPIGTYTAIANSPGYQQKQTPIVIQNGQMADVRLTLDRVPGQPATMSPVDAALGSAAEPLVSLPPGVTRPSQRLGSGSATASGAGAASGSTAGAGSAAAAGQPAGEGATQEGSQHASTRASGSSLGKLIIATDPQTSILVGAQNLGRGRAEIDVPPGRYVVRLEHPDRKSQSHDLTVRPGQRTEEFLSVLPNKGTAVFTGLILPGSGHLYSGRKRGWVYMLATGALGALAYSKFTEYENQSLEVDRLQLAYSSAREESQAIQARRALVEAVELRDATLSEAGSLSKLAGAVYAFSLFDILVTKPSFGYRKAPTGLATRESGAQQGIGVGVGVAMAPTPFRSTSATHPTLTLRVGLQGKEGAK